MQIHEYPPVIFRDGTRGEDGLDEIRRLAYEAAMAGRVRNILSVGKDAKTVKGEKYGYRTGVIYMAPGNISGMEVCRKRTKGCTAACLFTAGQGRFPNVKQGRLRRTYQFHYRRSEYFETLVNEIPRYKARAEADGKIFVVRPNGTSDIAYEKYPIAAFTKNGGGKVWKNIFEIYPDIQFYDYTKRVDRLKDIIEIPNYHVTFSRAETKMNQADTEVALALGINVTVVFRKELPAMWQGYPVISGDDHDFRPLDGFKHNGKPVIIGLKAKGEAVKDTSGFVID